MVLQYSQASPDHWSHSQSQHCSRSGFVHRMQSPHTFLLLILLLLILYWPVPWTVPIVAHYRITMCSVQAHCCILQRGLQNYCSICRDNMPLAQVPQCLIPIGRLTRLSTLICVMCCRSARVCLHQGMGGCRKQIWLENEAFYSTGEHSHSDDLCLLLWSCLVWRFCNLSVLYDTQDPSSVG